MAQLKMYWKRQQPQPIVLPEGFTVSNYKDESDIPAWIEICKNGLVGDDCAPEFFDECITDVDDCVPEKDCFFLDHNGKHIGTVSAIYHPEEKEGQVHMVGIVTEYRGKGLGKYLNNKAVEKLDAQGVDYIFLTTDEWRKGAVKSYLSSGFKPVEYDEGMTERWQAVLEEYGIDSVDMVDEDANFFKTVYRQGLQK